MSTPLARFESARAPGRVTWLSILGIVLVPLVVAGVLVWAFWNPSERLDQVNGAIVNNDTPVEIDGQTVPFGRQLAAGLVGGDAASDTNYTWVITDEDDAASGLNSGKFTAVVTIPENFSSAATSFSGEASEAEKATVDVATSDQSRLVDDAVSQVITTTAAGLVGNELTTSYLENVYVGFNGLGEQLGTAADGAAQLGAGATELATGASTLADGTTELSSGASGLATGISGLSGGLSSLASGLSTLENQTAALPTQAQSLATGAAEIADGIDQLQLAVAGQAVSLNAQAADLAALATESCTADPVGSQCAALSTAARNAAVSAGTIAAIGTPGELATGADSVSGGISALATGLSSVTAGISDTAAGASSLAAGGSSISAGASELADGVSELSTGAAGLSTGAAGVADGVNSLAGGLSEAVAAVPSYSESERTTLAEVVAEPVVADGELALSFGAAGVPFYAALALWLGAFGSLIVLRAKPARTLGSTRPSVLLALRAWAPAAGVGALQGILVAAILQPLVELDAGGWIGFAVVAALTGVAFAATNQALNAVFGGAGRFLSMIVALALIGTSIIATAPAALDTAQSFMPVHPAVNALHAVVTSGGGLGAAIVGLLMWTAGSLAATTLAIARSRTVTVRQLVPRAA
ncbi:YhgE/Pip family protein [Mycetocola miduiensis]|uniref:Putative membrane protein n=1 Tax=Mycetocola miduiensis TaxID=995034 RepID=A0A1I5B447_9MICO|nr:YhgE/Pip family protein [Mycetocola miduiensis]SFN69467.1 putative membrane protein [Mycetocola miduiensis]